MHGGVHMYGENTNTMAIPIYRVLPYPVIYSPYLVSACSMKYSRAMHETTYLCGGLGAFLWSCEKIVSGMTKGAP